MIGSRGRQTLLKTQVLPERRARLAEATGKIVRKNWTLTKGFGPNCLRNRHASRRGTPIAANFDNILP
jgi:hypothetical protein